MRHLRNRVVSMLMSVVLVCSNYLPTLAQDDMGVEDAVVSVEEDVLQTSDETACEDNDYESGATDAMEEADSTEDNEDTEETVSDNDADEEESYEDPMGYGGDTSYGAAPVSTWGTKWLGFQKNSDGVRTKSGFGAYFYSTDTVAQKDDPRLHNWRLVLFGRSGKKTVLTSTLLAGVQETAICHHKNIASNTDGVKTGYVLKNYNNYVTEIAFRNFTGWDFSATALKSYYPNLKVIYFCDDSKDSDASKSYKIATLNGNFSGMTSLQTIILPDCVTSVPASMFDGCSALTSAKNNSGTELKNYTTIGNYAFRGCRNYVTGAYDTSGKMIGTGAFQNCNITSLIVPDGSVGNFTGNPVQTLTMNSATLINSSCATFASSLQTLNAEKATTIEDGALANCSALKTVNIPAIKTLGAKAFLNCRNLGSIALSNVTIVNTETFSGCTGLSSVNLPNVTVINASGFKGCSNLSTLSVINCTAIGDSAFEGCSKIGALDIKKVTSIGSRAFYGCSSMSAASLDSLESIGSSAFYGCSGIKALAIDKAKVVGDSAFEGCSLLSALSLMSVTNIGKRAFYGIGSKTTAGGVTLTLPTNTLITIDEKAFNGGKLSDVYYNDTKEQWAKKIVVTTNLKDVFGSATIHCKDGDVKPDAPTSTPTPTPGPDDPTPTPGPGDPTPTPKPIIEEDLIYHSVIFYTAIDGVPKVVVSANVVHGGTITEEPQASYKDGYNFVGWYDLMAMPNEYNRWYPSSPIFRDMVLCAMFADTNGNIVIIVPEGPIPPVTPIDPDNPPAPTPVDPPGYDPNPMPPSGGTGDPNASALDGYVDLDSMSANMTLYVVKGQKMTLKQGMMNTGDKKIVSVSKKGIATAKKEGVTMLTVMNMQTGKTYIHTVNVVKPALSEKKLKIRAGLNADITILCGAFTDKYPIFWSSSNVDVAYVEKTATHGIAKVYGIGKGTATITAWVNGKKYNCKVTVKDVLGAPEAAGVVDLVPQQKLNIKTSGIGGSDGFNPTDCMWEYSTPGIVTVDKNGIMTAIGLGKTDVKGTNKNGQVKKFTVNVSSMAPHSLHINMGYAKKVSPYKVKVKKAIWSSSNPAIATASKGKISAHSVGTCLITAQYNGYIYRYYVSVENPNLKLTNNLNGADKKYTLGMVTGSLANIQPMQAFHPIVFESKKPEIAFCDENGFVRARAYGNAKITTKINGKKITIKTNVI